MVKFISTAVSVLSPFQTSMSTFTWRVALLAAALILIGCHGQTFQYSRGWTNGKRGGSYAAPAAPLSASSSGSGQAGQVFDVDAGGLVGAGSLEDSTAQSGTFHMLAPEVPQGSRLRLRDRDYYQLQRKLGSGVNSSNNNRKPPVWILRVDQQENNNAAPAATEF